MRFFEADCVGAQYICLFMLIILRFLLAVVGGKRKRGSGIFKAFGKSDETTDIVLRSFILKQNTQLFSCHFNQ